LTHAREQRGFDCLQLGRAWWLPPARVLTTVLPAGERRSARALHRDGGSEGGGGGSSPPYCLRNKRTLLQLSLKLSAINERLGIEEGVHALTCTTMEPSFTLL
jgi:hypothetical protein